MKVILIISITLFSLLITSCQKEKQEENADAMSGHKIVAEEVIQANSYTYIKASEGDQNYWVAVTKREIKEGATLYYALPFTHI